MVSYRWSSVDSDLDLGLYDNCESDDEGSPVVGCNSNRVIVIQPHTLAAGSIHVFRFEATNSIGTGSHFPDLSYLLGWAEVSVQVNTKPEGGCCNVSQDTVVALNESVRVECSNFVDIHTPLEYQFFWRVEEQTIPLHIGRAHTNALDFEIPSDGDGEIVARIYDSLGAFTEQIIPVQVEPHPDLLALSDSDLLLELLGQGELLDNNLKSATEGGNFHQAMRFLFAIGGSLGSQDDSSSMNFNRRVEFMQRATSETASIREDFIRHLVDNMPMEVTRETILLKLMLLTSAMSVPEDVNQDAFGLLAEILPKIVAGIEKVGADHEMSQVELSTSRVTVAGLHCLPRWSCCFCQHNKPVTCKTAAREHPSFGQILYGHQSRWSCSCAS